MAVIPLEGNAHRIIDRKRKREDHKSITVTVTAMDVGEVLVRQADD